MPLSPPAPSATALPRKSPSLPRHRVIYEALLHEIQSGLFPPGSRLPSEAMLCERFQASRITVAKAFQALQRQDLVTRRAGSGTYVQTPSQPDALQFGLLIPDLGATDIFESICQGIMRSPAALSHSLAWGSLPQAGGTMEATEALCRQYIAQGVAGVFFAPTEHAAGRYEGNHRIVAMLQAANIPVVLLDRCLERYPDRSTLDLVGIDNHRAGYLLTRHLIEAGAKRIVFAVRPNSAPTVDARIVGYRGALETLLPNAKPIIVSGDFEDARLVRAMLERHKPDGIICANDVTAARLMRTLIALKTRIPEDVRMVGVDDVNYARFLPTPLTTLRQNCVEIGAAAMTTMLERLRQPDQPARDVLVRCELVVRASCGTKAAAGSEKPS